LQKILSKLSNTTVSNIENQINILEWFLKDHVTLRTGEMADENYIKTKKTTTLF